MNDKQSSSGSNIDGIRLSSSSPAILGIMHHSNGNLNSLADAFAQHEKGESIHENRKGLSRSSYDVNQSELLRRYVDLNFVRTFISALFKMFWNMKLLWCTWQLERLCLKL